MSEDKRDFNQGQPKEAIGVLAQPSRDTGGTFHYTQALIEALGRYSKFKERLLILKNDAFDLKLKDNGFRCIPFNVRPTTFFEKLSRLLLISLPSMKFLENVHQDYQAFAHRPMRLLINPIVSLSVVFSKTPFITIIHDFQDRYYPQYFKFQDRLRRKLVNKCLAQGALFIVCESDCVKKDILKFLKVPEQKIRVIVSPPPSYLRACDVLEEFLRTIQHKYELPKEYLFYPAQFWPHKNHIRLVKSLAYLKEKYQIKIPLVLVGSSLDHFENVRCEINKSNLQEQIKYLGYVSDEEIVCLYKLAKALIVPSLFESMSLPVWEALSWGLPVLASKVCALPEQIGRAGIIFDPFSTEDMGEKIYQVWMDRSLREKLIGYGFARIKTLTLEHYAQQWDEVIEQSLCVN